MREPTIVIASTAIVAIAVVLISCQLQEASAFFFDDSAILKPSIMDGFSLYEDSIHKASIQYPSVWDRHQMFNSDYVTVVEFIIPGTLPPI